MKMMKVEEIEASADDPEMEYEYDDSEVEYEEIQKKKNERLKKFFNRVTRGRSYEKYGRLQARYGC